MIDHLFNVLEAARPGSFSEVTEMYKDAIPTGKIPERTIGLAAGEPKYISTGENARAIVQIVYIMINILILNKKEADVIAELRALAGKVKNVLTANLRLNNFLVAPGRILSAMEGEAAPTAENSQVYEIAFQGKYFEGGES